MHDGHSSVDRPIQELNIRRVDVAPGECKDVRFTLDHNALAFYSTVKRDWVTEPGEFDVLVGASSREIRGKGSLS